METTYVSTAALRNQPRLEIQRIQAELVNRTSELATGRKADIGLALGTDTGRMVSLRNEVGLLETLMRSNGVAAARLTLIQAALSDIRDNASSVLNSVIALPPGFTSAVLVEQEGRAALDRLADRMNGSDGRSFLFSGTDTTNAPFTQFEDGPEAAIASAFLTKFGVAVGSAGAAAISATDMTDFLNTEFAALFDDPAWGTTWSSASDDDLTSRIAVSERVKTGTNANEASLRLVTEGMSAIAGLGLSALSQEARDAVIDATRVRIGQAVSDVAALQSELGYSENAISRANERMGLARDLLTQTIVETEGADVADAKVRVDLLTTQLEMSFALTGQLSRLSILNYA
ncbi:flagellar hook-associated family protein [Acuticoccus sp. MNP-M23]|uniref:flagellar hook-associated family protein n=1 Tax=Acuticoccus sp. MNP-M23 TaxID=3072793 RepID=UPI002814F0BB|nr:flagellar hook-associated family protein [Acuticoccus sp. MNP-M23]WMS41810.1 flagellar hook-associated family protein [Acuticoccus sp. MNP-M23]